MKILCSDESGKDGGASLGSPAYGDEFVMCGLMVDAKNFFKASKCLDGVFSNIVKNRNVEFKAKDLMKGKGRYRSFSETQRRGNLKRICNKINEFDIDIFAIGFSFSNINKKAKKRR